MTIPIALVLDFAHELARARAMFRIFPMENGCSNVNATQYRSLQLHIKWRCRRSKEVFLGRFETIFAMARRICKFYGFIDEKRECFFDHQRNPIEYASG
jgi:hypothetical protein